MTETPEGVVVTQDRNSIYEIAKNCPRHSFAEYQAVDERDVDAALVAYVPGGASAYCWLPMTDGYTVAEVARDVMRSAIAAVDKRRAAHTPTLRGEEVERLREAANRKLGFRHNPPLPAERVTVTRSDLQWLLDRFPACDPDAALSQPLAVDTGQSVPAGWKLVPIEPTPRMIAKGWGHSDLMVERETHSWRDEMRTAWSAMLAAAPAPSVSPDPAGEEAGTVAGHIQDADQKWLEGARYATHVDGQENAARVELERRAALASSPIPKTFPREAVERLTAIVQREANNGADSPADYGDAEQIVRAVLAALLQEDRQS